MPVRRMIAMVRSRSRQQQRHRLQLSEAAARASYSAVYERIGTRTTEMSLAEARGYVRSVSVRATRRELRQLLIGHPSLAESEFVLMLDRAVEHVTRMILSRRLQHGLPEPRLQEKGLQQKAA